MHHRRLFSLPAAVSCVSVLVACGLQQMPIHPSDDPEWNAGGVPRTGIAKDPPLPLVLRTGDTLTVRTISKESFEYPGLVVDSEGKVHVPSGGAIVVAGLSPAQAERRIEQVLRKFDRFVRVSVLITDWGGHYATVLGAVVTEGTVMLTPGMRLAELVARAGGPLRTSESDVQYVADLDAARLTRDGKVLPVSLRKALEGQPRHNILVHPGDQLFVPVSLDTRVAVLGHVAAGGRMLTYRQGMRLSEALASAGGITIDADDNDIRVIRGPLESPKVYVTSLEDLVDGDGTDVELAPGDIVFVSEHWVAQMGEVLDRIAPLLGLLQTGINTALLVETIRARTEDSASP